MSGEPTCQFTVMTAPQPGAIAIVQLHGEVTPVLRALTGRADWPVGRLRLVSLGGIDDGLAGRLAEDTAQLMPHGGRRVVQRLAGRLDECGARPAEASSLEPRDLYPEAADALESLMLGALARAASPLAIDALLSQPAIWRDRPAITGEDRARSARLDRLIEPPLVVVAGMSNIGKSTLSNTLIGRSISIALDQPGTTRDYTSARVELDGLVVQWHDTPGLRSTSDVIETKAISLACRLMERADLLIAMTDHRGTWPVLPRKADLRLAGKADLGARDDADLAVSALSGEGIPALVAAARERLVPAADLEAARVRPWLFDERLDRPAHV